MNRNRGSRRPNRGGGRFNKLRSPRPNRVSAQLNLEPGLELEDEDDEADLMDTDLVGHNRNLLSTSNDKIPVRSKGKSKALVQRLRMSAENQKMVEEMFRDLQIAGSSQDYNNVSYNVAQIKSNAAYWQKYGDQRLVVEGGVNFAAYGDCNEQVENCEEEFSYYAMKKLLQCGFEKNRCLEALRGNDGDVGIALESLLCCCCALTSLGKENPSYSAERAQEAALQRQEEALALESIYDETFSEVITDRVWSIKLSLPFVLEAFQPKTIKGTNKEQSGNSKKKSCKAPDSVCKYFLQGHCKFGDKCRMSHSLPVESTSSRETADKRETSKTTVGNIDPFPFHLEVRFCRESLYPFEPPMIVFYSTCELIPPSGCLNVTQRLCEEAKNLCESESPAIFCLINLLENENEIIECLFTPTSEFSLPEKKMVGDLITPGKYEKYFDNDNNNLANRQKVTDRNSLDKKHQASSDQIGTQEITRRLKQQFHRLQTAPGYKSMLEQRKKLPAWKSQDEIIRALQSHQVIVISGMTGCGKTTQIPQFILDHHLSEEISTECFIVCTQPRRISAMSVAERVSAERVDKIGGSVGYQVRLENKQSSGTRLLYCTTGILLRRLEGESSLPGVSHVIVDEVHERTEESDFLMMVLKDLINVRADLHIILMSATLNAKLFSEYFYDAPVIYIPGRTFPVVEFFLEDSLEMTEFQVDPSSPYAKAMKCTSISPHSNSMIMKKGQMTKELQQIQDSADFSPPGDDMDDQNLSEDQMAWRYYNFSKRTVTSLCTMDHEKINYDLVVALLEWIVGEDHEYPKNGSILVFLPGIGEILALSEHLQKTTTFSSKNSDRFRIIPLHSMLSSEEQSLVFKKPKDGVRKIVLSTNIAETSVTIDDVVFVIDSGKMKENRYDSTKGMESLEEVWVSQANARQRRGRAGRVTSGVCFHLFTRYRYEHKIAGHQVPEIKRVPLEKLCLRIKVLGLFFGRDIKEVLGKLLEPPSEESINSSVKRLHNIGALDTEENLTSLGFHLAALPVDVRIAKLMLLGAIFRCLDPVLTIGAILSYKSPFSAPFDKREEADKKRQEMAVGNSDHLTLLRSYKGWLEAMERGFGAGYHYCRTNFVSMKTLQMIASLKCQYAELLSDIGFINANLTARKLARIAPRTGDGVLAATSEENMNSNNQKLVLGVVCAALFPNVVQVVKPDTKFKVSSTGAVPMDAKAAELKFWTKSDGQVFIHPKSVNFQVNSFDSPYLVYHEKVKTSKVYIRDSSMVSVYALLLFCGDCLSVNLEKGTFVVSIDDGWIRFTASSFQLLGGEYDMLFTSELANQKARTVLFTCVVASLVRDLRTELDRLLADKIENPSLDLRTCPRGSRIIDTIVRLIATQ